MVDMSAVLLPLLPNWRDSYSRSYEYKTDISVSRSRREQRGATRTLPRKRVEGTYTIAGDVLSDFNGRMAKSQNGTIVLPDPLRHFTTTANISAGVAAFTLASVPSWVRTDIWLCFTNGVTWAAYPVASVAGSMINLAAATVEAWPAGTLVYFGFSGLLDDDIQGQMATNGVAEIALRYSVLPGTDVYDDVGTIGTMFNGREIFPFKANWASPPTQTFRFSPERTDLGVGIISFAKPVPYFAKIEQCSFVGRTFAEALAIRQFFSRMKGQRGEFYRPTGLNDLAPNSDLISGQSTLLVAGKGVANNFANNTVFKAIRVLLDDGSELYRKVTGITISGNNSVVAVDSGWTSTISTSRIVMVSWMPAWRFSSDLLTLEWITDSVAQTAITMQTLEDLTGE